MTSISLGIRVGVDGVTFFGFDEVNSLLIDGHSIARIDPPEAVFDKSERGESIKLTLVGFNLNCHIVRPSVSIIAGSIDNDNAVVTD